MLTGSGSKGNGGKYYYYHYNNSCKTPFKADNADELFPRHGAGLCPRHEHGLQDQNKGATSGNKGPRRPNRSRNQDIVKGQNLLSQEKIDSQVFREIKRENKKKVERLEAQLLEISSQFANIEPLLEKVVSNLAHLDELYRDGDTKQK